MMSCIGMIYLINWYYLVLVVIIVLSKVYMLIVEERGNFKFIVMFII